MFKVFSDEELFASLDKDGIQLFPGELKKAKRDKGGGAILVDLGDIYYDRNGYSKALAWYLKAANSGNPAAKTNIGYMYQKGFGVSQDYSQAMNWYLKAASDENATAWFDIGCMYQKGLDVVVDCNQAKYWYLKAANKGSSDAQSSIGYLYHQGLCGYVDYGKALKWYLKAVENNGDNIAQNNIGELYLRGLGVTKDVLKAIEWFTNPAKQGVDESQYYFGWIYENEGEFRDLQKAANWYQKASDSGYEEAKFALKRLNDKGYYPTDDYKEEEKPQKVTNTVNSNKSGERATNCSNISINNNEQEQLPPTSQRDQDRIPLMEEKIKKLEEAVQFSLSLIQQDRDKKNSLKQKIETLEQENAKIKADQKEKDEEYRQLKEMIMQYKAAMDDNLSHDTSYDFFVEASDRENDINSDTS